MTIYWWVLVLIILGCLLVGLVAGFFITRAIFQKQLRDNPPINRNMIRAMYLSLGRKPSERDINRTIAEMERYK